MRTQLSRLESDCLVTCTLMDLNSLVFAMDLQHSTILEEQELDKSLPSLASWNLLS